jgi:hypothetical protein
VLRYPTRVPRLRELFDLKLVGLMACLVLVGIASCDLVNRALDKRLLPGRAAAQPETWQPNQHATLILALKTQDAERHACASEFSAGNALLRCDYENTKRRLPRPTRPVDDNLVNVLQPYLVESVNQPVLLSGVWHSPQIAYRRHLEPARDRRRELLQTFYAQCEVEFLERFSSVDVRYEIGKSWTTLKNVPVGRVVSCTILRAPEAKAI